MVWKHRQSVGVGAVLTVSIHLPSSDGLEVCVDSGYNTQEVCFNPSTIIRWSGRPLPIYIPGADLRISIHLPSSDGLEAIERLCPNIAPWPHPVSIHLPSSDGLEVHIRKVLNMQLTVFQSIYHHQMVWKLY